MTKKEKQFMDDMVRLRGMAFVRLGMMVETCGEIATITGMSPSANLFVVYANRLKHGKNEKQIHPTWGTRYFDINGNVIADFTEGDQ